MRCGSDLSLISCKESCNQVAECGHSCSARCHECQSLNKGDKVDRVRHIPHPCKRDLLCGHPCLEDCTPGHECSGTCRARCRQSCTHQPCYKGCSKSCSPCLQPCTWVCDHEKCLLPCGSVRYISNYNSCFKRTIPSTSPDMQPSTVRREMLTDFGVWSSMPFWYVHSCAHQNNTSVIGIPFSMRRALLEASVPTMRYRWRS